MSIETATFSNYNWSEVNIFEAVISIVSPFNCMGCGIEGKYICDRCVAFAYTAVPSRCYRCRTATLNFKTCPSCRSSSSLRRVYVPTALSGTAKQLIHAFKFERVQSVAPIIAAQMLKSLEPEDEYLVVPIPTATSHVRQRGYDHSLLLARKIAKDLNYQHVPAVLKLNQLRQVGSGRQERTNQLKNGFGVLKPRIIKNRRILLVDDVITTGATLEEVARILKNSGAKSIDALVFAQR